MERNRSNRDGLLPWSVGIEAAQLGNTAHAGGNQEQVGTNPGSWGGETGGSVAEHGNQKQSHYSTSCHFQHSGQNGKGAEPHALDGEADDIHQRQGEEKGRLDDNILTAQFQQKSGVRLSGIQEEKGTLGGKLERTPRPSRSSLQAPTFWPQ